MSLAKWSYALVLSSDSGCTFFYNVEQCISIQILEFGSVHLPLVSLDKACVLSINYVFILYFIFFTALILPHIILVSLLIA